MLPSRLFPLLIVATWAPAAAAQSGADDRAVLAAIVELSIRPHLALQARRENADLPVYVSSQSLALCKDVHLGDCVARELAEGVASMSHLQDIVTPGRAAQLNYSFAARNRTRRAFAHPGNRGVTMMSEAALVKHFETLHHQPERGVSFFSSPAYSQDGYALVYWLYHCGGPVCGSDSLIVLQRSREGWIVLRTQPLTIF